MNRITASGLHRLMRCPGHVNLKWEKNSTTYSEIGVKIHKAIETMSSDGLSEDELRQYEYAMGVILQLTKQPSSIFFEHAYCINVNYPHAAMSIERCSLIKNREYPESPPGDIWGTSDVVVLSTSTNDAHIVDWKTGGMDIGAIADNEQLMWAAAYYYSVGRIPYIHIANTAMRSVVSYKPNAMELGLLVADVKRMYYESMSESAELNVGSACKYCPAINACAKMSSAVESFKFGAVSAKNASDAAMKVLMVEEALELAKKKLNLYVDEHGPITLPDGSLYAKKHRTVDSFSYEDMRQELEKLGVDTLEAAHKSFTKKSIKEHLGEAAAEHLFEEMRKDGTIKEIQTTSYGLKRVSSKPGRASSGDGNVRVSTDISGDRDLE
jgi:hypothetical protein